MSELETPKAVIAQLVEAEAALTRASHCATEREDDRSGLQGELALLIGGLAQATSSLIGLVNDRKGAANV